MNECEKIYFDAVTCFENGNYHCLDLKEGCVLSSHALPELLTEHQRHQAAVDYILFLSSQEQQLTSYYNKFYNTVYIPNIDRPSLAEIPPTDIIYFISPQTAKTDK